MLRICIICALFFLLPIAPEVAAHRARVAALARGVRAGERPESDLAAARADFTAVYAKARIEKILAAAPPLTNEQRAQLAELLRPVRVTPEAAPRT
jgi:hypothetical protein